MKTANHIVVGYSVSGADGLGIPTPRAFSLFDFPMVHRNNYTFNYPLDGSYEPEGTF